MGETVSALVTTGVILVLTGLLAWMLYRQDGR